MISTAPKNFPVNQFNKIESGETLPTQCELDRWVRQALGGWGHYEGQDKGGKLGKWIPTPPKVLPLSLLKTILNSRYGMHNRDIVNLLPKWQQEALEIEGVLEGKQHPEGYRYTIKKWW